ncbi:laccase-25-like precursor [Iris pallida]|uniref:laccase n=1 Tax=Iris pallida TaxID=29817 RepID=A0AAX6H3K4_IRIPA|nr:laccase-25-like precursor [Iris pallida]
MCSYKQTYKLEVVQGETYMLRIINAALNNQLFFKVANHSFTVVAVDASYTMPYKTDVIVIAPGQTVDALMVADASPSARYYMAARAYASAVNLAFDSTTTTGIVQYKPVGTNRSTTADPPVMPSLPDFFDTPTAYRFYTNLTALIKPASPKVPLDVDERMFVTIGLGFAPCGAGQTACMGQALSASMNNVSFAFPTGCPYWRRSSRAPRGYTPRIFRHAAARVRLHEPEHEHRSGRGLPVRHSQGYQGEKGKVRRRGGDGAPEHGVAGDREPSDAPPRLRFLCAGAGVRELQC